MTNQELNAIQNKANKAEDIRKKLTQYNNITNEIKKSECSEIIFEYSYDNPNYDSNAIGWSSDTMEVITKQTSLDIGKSHSSPYGHKIKFSQEFYDKIKNLILEEISIKCDSLVKEFEKL